MNHKLREGSTDALIVVISMLAIGLFIGWIFIKNAGPPRTNREVALACTTDMATQFHIHPHLEIDINGKAQEIPANIGILSGCMHPIHTHDVSGTLHVESPEQRDFTLSVFFAVWDKPFTKNQILDYKIDNSHLIRETVNGTPVQDYENTILRDKDQIVISYEATAERGLKTKK